MALKKLTLDERIDLEAKEIAKSLIETELMKSNLPLPRNLDTHIGELIRLTPAIMAQAKERVEAKSDAYGRALAAVGIDPDPVQSHAISISI